MTCLFICAFVFLHSIGTHVSRSPQKSVNSMPQTTSNICNFRIYAYTRIQARNLAFAHIEYKLAGLRNGWVSSSISWLSSCQWSTFLAMRDVSILGHERFGQVALVIWSSDCVTEGTVLHGVCCCRCDGVTILCSTVLAAVGMGALII